MYFFKSLNTNFIKKFEGFCFSPNVYDVSLKISIIL